MEETIRCFSCNKALMNVLIKDTTINKEHHIQAICPFCGDKSILKTYTGIIYTGPIGSEQSSTPTEIEDIEFEDNKNIFKIRKLK